MSFEIALKSLPIFYAFTIAINFFSVFYKGSHGIVSFSLHNRRFFGVLQACEGNCEARKEHQTRKKRSPEKRTEIMPVIRTMFDPFYSVGPCSWRLLSPLVHALLRSFFPLLPNKPAGYFLCS